MERFFYFDCIVNNLLFSCETSKMQFDNFENGINLNLNVRGLQTSSTLAINEISNKLIAEGKEVIKLGLGQSPFPVPDEVVLELQRNAYQKDYLPVKGLPELRSAVAEFNYRTQKVKTNPGHVMIGPGSKELIFLLQLVYYGDLIIPTPSWVSYSPQARIIGRNVHWVQTSKENDLRLSPENLENFCKKDPSRPRIVILNYPSNPTGATYPIERLKFLAEVARKYKVILVSDEIYGLLHHKNQHVSIARFYPEGTIISNGLSKWCGAGGWRLGTFSFPPKLTWLLDAMAVAASETFTSTSAPIQFAAIKAFEGGQFMEEYLKKVRNVLKITAKFIIRRFDSLNILYPKPQGAFYVFPNFENYRVQLNKAGIFNSVELSEKLLRELGIALLPGVDFGMEAKDLSVRLAYVDFDGKAVLDAIDDYSENGLTNNRENELQFLKLYVPKIVSAMDKIDMWLKKLPE